MLEHNLAGLFTDLWALGCIMYELDTGKQMFRGKNVEQVYTRINEYDVQFPSNMDKNLVDLISRLTEYDQCKRIGLKNISMIKNHPYFEGFDFESLKDKQMMCPPMDLGAKNPSLKKLSSFGTDYSFTQADPVPSQ